MARIHVLGTGPLLDSKSRIMSGQCLRTWHFCKPLLEAGHDVRLATVPIPGTTGEEGQPPAVEEEYEGFRHNRLTRNDEGTLLPFLREEIARQQPDVLLGINAWPAYLLARLGSGLPFWADLNGWTMAEGLVRAAVMGDDGDFGHFWRLEAATILAADRFSTVTERQFYALQGELAMLGGMSRHRLSDPIGTVVPNAVHPSFAALKRRHDLPEWLGLPKDALVCLWSGGFNSWTDVPCLVEALVQAFEQERRLHLVCTGGAVHGHDEETWERFLSGVEERLPPDRVHPLGWCELEKVLSLHECATVGINVDGDNMETRFGARNRLTNMMGAGVPVVTTRGTEIAHWIEKNNLGRVVDHRNPSDFARALVEACTDKSGNERLGALGREAALRDFSAASTLGPLLQWLDEGMPRAQRPDRQSPPDILARWAVAQSLLPKPFNPTPPPAPTRPVGILRRMKRYLLP